MADYAEKSSGWSVGGVFVLNPSSCSLILEEGSYICHWKCGFVRGFLGVVGNLSIELVL